SIAPAQGETPHRLLVPGPHETLGQHLMRWNQIPVGREWPDEACQTFIEIGSTGKIMQDALVNTERTEGQCAPIPHFDKSPATQWSSGSERVPMCIRKDRECQRKRRG